MTPTSPPKHLRIYLLSFWRESHKNDSSQRIRFSLEDPRMGEQQVYPSLGMLVTALEKILLETPGDIKI